ncbi:hypothetical protein ES703_88343 [subsurface metagenome]
MGTSIPYLPALSAAMALSPPPSDKIATRFPLGSGQLLSTAATSNSSSAFGTLIIPACLNAASTIMLSPASEPVWEAAALAPAAVSPTLRTTIGLFLTVSRAILISLFPSFIPSR